MVIHYILLAVFYLTIPFIIYFLVNRYDIFRKTGSIFLAYIIGILAGNVGMIPTDLYNFQETFSGVSVLVAIPLLLFTVKIKALMHTTGPVLKCFLGGLVAVIITVASGYLIWGHMQPDMWKTSGMLVGVYTGGTPNLASIQTALNVAPEHFVLLNTYDMLLSSIYLLFLFTLGKKWFVKWLGKSEQDKLVKAESIKTNNYKLTSYAGSIGMAVLIVVLAAGTSFLFYGEVQMLYVILIITTLSLLLSFVPKMNGNGSSTNAGMYFILVFSVAVASMADISRFQEVAPFLLRYLSWVVFGSLLLHLLWCRIFNLKGDLMMVTSVALICSPPFVPVIAGQINNKNLIVGGLTVGLIGYAIGNYLGITLAWILKII
ncbi:putative integral membrane protein [Salinivirga cyanobacteriivorans]|uniref:Putative integral membrane protein n=1 Tax=Salinivirga cyanobacteriivorans TaxID=1307839 RepID=A0A0S2HVJ4_9BACT|nr:DUF819 family protein [Salinivirga cyanobacteriivorans]ALO13964.1 putative integral membrane protein [Salinivirga cyanobacteriivorans]